jgi:hypothetical protein
MNQLENEIALLERYRKDFEQRRLDDDAERVRQMYKRQIELVRSQFPDSDAWKIHLAELYHQMAIVRYADMKGAWGPEALELVNQAIATHDSPRHRMMKATLCNKIGQTQQAIVELDHIIGNFPDSKIYLDARQLKDEIESQPKGGCFIATAVYGSPMATEVVLLSRFRDQVLLRSRLGSLFVRFYYHVSPALARLISRAEVLRVVVRRLVLKPLLRWLG